jgi:gas vesicle protein
MLSVINKFDYTKIEILEEKLDQQQQRYMELMTNNVKLQDKTSDAYVLAKESSAVAKGTQREVEASLNAIRNEVQAELDSVKEKMKALQKATTNPLGR